MSNSIDMILTFSRGIRFLGDLKKLKSTPQLRDTLESILDENFNKKFVRCPPYIYYCISTIFGILALASAISLLHFVGTIGFAVLPFGILGIISPLFYFCIFRSRTNKLFYHTMSLIDSETMGIHKMTGHYNDGSYIQKIKISTNEERLLRMAKKNPQKPEKVEKVPLMSGNKPQNPPIHADKIAIQNDDHRNTGTTFPQSNRFSQPGMGPFPMYGPMPQNPHGVNPGQQGNFIGYGNQGAFDQPIQYSPFGPNLNMNQGGDLVIHEVDVNAGGNNKMKNQLYEVPSDVVDDHIDNKK